MSEDDSGSPFARPIMIGYNKRRIAAIIDREVASLLDDLFRTKISY